MKFWRKFNQYGSKEYYNTNVLIVYSCVPTSSKIRHFASLIELRRKNSKSAPPLGSGPPPNFRRPLLGWIAADFAIEGPSESSRQGLPNATYSFSSEEEEVSLQWFGSDRWFSRRAIRVEYPWKLESLGDSKNKF